LVEQVMQAAQVLAGYSLGSADLLRRAMGKKIKSEMDAQRATFVEGCATHNGIPAAKANELFDLIDKFAGYGFNKSHAAAYALVAYHTAWLKAHHRPEFYAASMSFDMAQTDKLSLFVEDMRRGGTECLPPCVNSSDAFFTVEEGAVRYALGALKGVGEKAMDSVVADRAAKGAFKSLENFAERIEPRLLNRKQIESLAGGGAFDVLEPNRASVFAAAETILAHAASAADQRESGQHGLFQSGDSTVPPIRLPSVEWSLAQRMAAERESFGFYFSGHPVQTHEHLLAAHKVKRFEDLGDVRIAEGERVTVSMAALVEDARWRTSAKGRRFLTVMLSDPSGQFQATAFDDEPIEALQKAAEKGACALLTVELDRRSGDETPRAAVKRVQPLDSLAKRTRLQLLVSVRPDQVEAVARELASCRGGNGTVRLHVVLGGGGEATILAGRDFTLDAEVAERVQRIAGEGNVDLSVQEPPKLALVG
jgi:DNA polymerase-3 subunit alpha